MPPRLADVLSLGCKCCQRDTVESVRVTREHPWNLSYGTPETVKALFHGEIAKATKKFSDGVIDNETLLVEYIRIKNKYTVPRLGQ